MISNFGKQGIDVLSANTYESDGKSYVKPYTIKQVDTSEGTVNLGILGLTIKEVREKNDFDENGNLVPAKSRELKDQYGYDGKLYKNKSGEDVIVTQPGKHAECISKINFKLDKNKDGWEVVSKSSKITQFEKSPEVDNFGKLIYDIASIDGKKEEINLSEISSFEWDKDNDRFKVEKGEDAFTTYLTHIKK